MNVIYFLVYLLFVTSNIPLFALDVKEKIKKYGWEDPTFEQALLLAKAKKSCCIKKRIHAACMPEESQSQMITLDNESLIAIGKTFDQNLAQAMAYHELGHVITEDSTTNFLIERGDLDLAEATSQPDVRELIDTIKQSINKALKVLNNSTATSRVIQSILSLKNTTIIDSFNDLLDFNDMMDLFEIQEHRADLFAASKLIHEKNYSPLLAMITDLLSMDTNNDNSENLSDMAENQDMFFIRRVIVLLGFMANHNIDINKILSEWEKQGQCIDIKNI